MLHVYGGYWVTGQLQPANFYCLCVSLVMKNHLVICMLTYFQVKKHIKQGEGQTGGIFSIEAPLHVSNVQVIDPVTGYDTFGHLLLPLFSRDKVFICLHTKNIFVNILTVGNHARLHTSIWEMGLK